MSKKAYSIRLDPLPTNEPKKSNFTRKLHEKIDDGSKIAYSSKISDIKSIKDQSEKHQISSLGKKIHKMQEDNKHHYPVGKSGMSMYEIQQGTKKLQSLYKGGRKRKCSRKKISRKKISRKKNYRKKNSKRNKSKRK